MKKIILYCVFAMSATVSLCAQDIIVTTDAQKIEAKILEVSKSEIRYKEKDNLDGPTFVLSTEEISSIVYANGKVVLYNRQAKDAPQRASTTIDENTADILLLSGNIITAQITELKSNYVAYSVDGKSYTLPASQIEKVTFLQNGQIKVYNDGQTTISSQPTATSKTGRIYRDNGQYYYNETYISSKEVERILQRENKAAYRQWKKADGMLIGGSICTGIGGGLVVGGLISLIGSSTACIAMECSALVPLGIGLGLTLGASSRYNKAINLYNSKYDQAAVQFKWRVAPTEIGFAFAF